MRKCLIAFFMIVLLSVAVQSEDQENIQLFYPVNTYSIVCYDSATGQFGAAVQSHWFKVADVIWAEPDVGVVATQSLADFSYGKLGLEMMKTGKTAQQALDGLKASDPNSDVRQVAMIDNHGNIATHTGENCIAMAGHRSGANYSVQANLMEKSTVWDAMAEAFENSEGELADRMMAALEAAQAEGGDIRGMQSAAMLVVTGEPTGMPWVDKIVDLRVDDSPEPLKELRRLININRAYEYMNLGDEYFFKGEVEKAKEAYSKSAELAPGNPEILFWQAVTMASAGEEKMAMPIFKQVFEMDEKWRVLVPRLVDSGLLPDNPGLIERIVGQ
ncbi:MAG: DUF1028 domain-containing protein [candidate division Zixibacteria bacterium]|nr:DUF1028 domain-containing protein [candidate division Zixibacteria bacterium]